MSVPAEMKLLDLEQQWFLQMSDFQAFSMALYDARALGRDQRLNYVMDGYDFCEWFFPHQAFRGTRKNPHHRAMRYNWDTFFDLADGDHICGVLSPFTILEFLATAESRLSDGRFLAAIAERHSELNTLLESLHRHTLSLDDLPQHDSETIRALYNQMLDIKTTASLLGDTHVFMKLSALLKSGRLKLFDPLIPEPAQRTELLQCDEGRTNEALSYLRKRRGSHFENTTPLYCALDVYHFVTVDNSRRALRASSILPYLTSSGILSRNSWYMLKYGVLPGDPLSVPTDWSVRASSAPTVLLRALQLHHDSPSQAEDFLEEARSYARTIIRDLRTLPELRSCIESPHERRRLHAENPAIRIPDSTISCLSLLEDRYRTPVALRTPPESDFRKNPSGVDAGELLEFINQPSKRAEAISQGASSLAAGIKELGLVPKDWSTYIAPMGDEVYSMLQDIAGNMGIPV